MAAPSRTLCPVHAAVPGRATVHQLVSQYIKPVENEAQHLGSVAGLKCLSETSRRRPELLLLIFETIDSVMVLPKRIENVAVIQKHLYRPGKSLPDRHVDSLFGIECYQSLKIAAKGSTLAGCHRLKFPLIRISGIERNPEENETSIIILAGGFCSADPTNGTMSA